MKNRYLLLLISILTTAFAVFPLISHANEAIPATYSLAPMLDKVTPAVVKINTAKETSLDNPFELNKKKPQGEQLGLGSGIIVDASQGLIITNAHVVNKAKLIVVTLKNGRRYRAKLIGEDDGFDIAVVKINAKNLIEIPMGDSDQLQVGDFVAAIGSPFGLTQTVTSGVVSALNRSEPKIEGYQSFIQTDTPINPGNSGGALVNIKGELIGINTALVTPIMGNVGIGFAIPSNMAKSVAQQLVKYGEVKRGILGVIAQDITTSLADALDLKSVRGAVVTTIIPNSPADKAGIKISDIILKLDGKNVHNAEQLRDTLAIMRPSTKIKMLVSRQGKTMTLTATVGDPKKLAKQQELPFIAGLQLQEFSELEANDTYLKGIIVTGVSEISPAALAGLAPGDVITIANHQPVTTIEQLKKIALSHPKQLLLKVSRHNTGLFVVIDEEENNG